MKKFLYCELWVAASWAFVFGLELGSKENPVNLLASALCCALWWVHWMYRVHKEENSEES